MTTLAEMPLLYDHYHIERVLGSGAMGMVYLARDVRLGRQVALKTLHSRRQLMNEPGPVNAFERFRREAQLCSALIHPNIVTLYEAGYEGQRFTYLAMEFIDGESLQSLLKREKKLDFAAACKIAYDILLGLAYAHSHGIIHRDIKPANVLLTRSGQAKIADFGIATSSKVSSGELTDKGQLLGTPHYMSPEQISGKEIDQRADLFSVGVIFYEMLSGRKPFNGSGLTDVLYDVVNRAEESLDAREAPAWCASVVTRLLAKRPDDRFATAADAARELRYLLNEHGVITADEPLPVQFSIRQERSADDTPTTPIRIEDTRQKTGAFEKTVSTFTAVASIAAALMTTGGLIFMLQRHIDDTPRAVVTEQQRAEFEQKEAELREARLLYSVGAYSESLDRFDDYLQRYPHSIAAREGRDRARQALRTASNVRTNAKVDVIESRTPRDARVKDAEEKPSLWKRVRSWFSRRH